MSATGHDPERADDPGLLTDIERLQLHQLRTLEYLEKARLRSRMAAEEANDETKPLPETWELTRGVELYGWQHECVDRWFRAKGRGTIKVVTGAGKTLLALAVAERLQRERDPELRVAIVVPTIVLMEQWYAELRQRSNLPAAAIGRLGGGFHDDFGGGRRVLVAVLASASQKLPAMVRKAEVGEHLLLVVDECHRAGAGETRKVLRTKRAWSLGLSATPEREEDEEEGAGRFEDSVIGRALGKIVYEMTLADALELGLLPPFRIRHYGLLLEPRERREYDRLSRQISDLESELRSLAPPKARGGAFFAWLRGGARRGQAAPLAARYLGLVDRRRRVLFGMVARRRAVQRP